MPLNYKNTFYTNGLGKKKDANISIESMTPNDTIVLLTPMGIGTNHRIKLSGPTSKVYRFTGQDGYIEDNVYTDYWIKAAREALKNKENLSFWQKIIRTIQAPFYQKGGAINPQEQEELQYAVIGYVMSTNLNPSNEQELMQVVQALIQLKQKEPEQYAQLVQLGMQQKAIKAKYGTKLDYVKKLKGKCPKGQELKQKGGKMVCMPCMKKKK